MYTWGYIKNATLAKLDMSENDANRQGLIGRFSFYANEAITQISSTVKPKHTFFEVNVTEDNVNTLITMPEDFIAFGDDVNYIVEIDPLVNKSIRRRAYDDDFEYVGYNQILCNKVGKYIISYDAIWIFFNNQADNLTLEVPADILNCLPSYIASECLKIDDENKATILRNEYEVFLSRVNDTNYKNTKNFRIEGDW